MTKATKKAEATENEPKDSARRPNEFVSKEHKARLGREVEERQTDALSDNHNVKPHYGFKTQKETWINANEEERHALVYGLVMHDGAIAKGGSDITRFFGIAKKDFEPFKDTFEMAKVALKLKIQRNVLSLGLQREDQVNLKFNLLKQYAEQVNDPAHEGVESVQAAPPAIVINEIKGNNQELRDELDAMVRSSMGGRPSLQ